MSWRRRHRARAYGRSGGRTKFCSYQSTRNRKGGDMSDPIETGDIYFFYRPKVDVDRPQAIDDVQRFYLVMVPDEGAKSRLFVVGKKRLPEIHPGQSKSREREWMMTTLASTPEKIGEELGPVVYETK